MDTASEIENILKVESEVSRELWIYGYSLTCLDPRLSQRWCSLNIADGVLVRGFSEKDVRKLLRDKRRLRGIFQQKEDRFGLCYEHPSNKDLDVIVIVDAKHVKSKLMITVVTVFRNRLKGERR